jgi:hypothetical protein
LSIPRVVLLLLVLALVGCAPQSVMLPPAAPTAIPFPTMTPGRQIVGVLPTTVPENAPLLANPATAVALASAPTATPDTSACPTTGASVSFVGTVEGGLSIPNGAVTFLNAGGTIAALTDGLAAAELLGETGGIATSFDFTGEGVPEVVVSFDDPELGGMLLILVCENGRYVNRYQAVTGGRPPEVLRYGDMNFDANPDLLFTSEVCSAVDNLCQYRTTLVTWTGGQFVNLMNTPPDGDIPPTFGDIDSDNVYEIITRQDGRGNSDTGPLRTGTQIYDWNGTSYVLSFVQPDPLRYVIQALHEADAAFREERMDDAARLYNYALDEATLGYWFGGNEDRNLRAYALYRLLLTYTFAENGDPLNVYERVRTDAPGLENVPVYVRMADVFWNQYQESNNLNVACTAVLALVDDNPVALDLLNRYGTRNPTYTRTLLCPF